MQIGTAKNAVQKMQMNAFAPPRCQNGACDTNLSMDGHNKRKMKARQMQRNAKKKKHLHTHTALAIACRPRQHCNPGVQERVGI